MACGVRSARHEAGAAGGDGERDAVVVGAAAQPRGDAVKVVGEDVGRADLEAGATQQGGDGGAGGVLELAGGGAVADGEHGGPRGRVGLGHRRASIARS